MSKPQKLTLCDQPSQMDALPTSEHALGPLLATDSPYGELRLGVPQHALRFYVPSLWPEAEMDARY